MPIQVQDMLRQFTSLMCSFLLVAGASPLVAQPQEQQQPAATEEPAPKIPNDQLDSLVAPIALYQDELLAQVLVAATYPLEIVQLQQFLAKHKDLKDKALADAVMKENWDASIQAMAALPEVVKRLSDDIKWTTDLGNAVLAQQSDVMDAVQRMRAKAQDKGNLKSNEQMKVETRVVESKSVIVIEQSKPDVVYVPSYDPVVVYGAPPYPYPPISYPPPGYYAAGMAISFGVGMAMGAAWGGGGWCCNSGWGGNNNININNNNTFVNNSNKQNVNNRQNSGNRTGGGNSWQHNPQHRGGAPYSNKATANKFGGQTGGRQNQAGGRNQAGNMDRGGRPQAGSMDRGGKPQAGSMDRGAGGANRGGGGGGDKVGNRSVSSGAGSSSKGGGFGSGGSSSRSSGSSARASSSRGSSSMGGSRGGGRRR